MSWELALAIGVGGLVVVAITIFAMRLFRGEARGRGAAEVKVDALTDTAEKEQKARDARSAPLPLGPALVARLRRLSARLARHRRN